MTPVDNRPNDTKLLLGIAGLVVLGTAGIALLAGWSVNGDEKTPATRSAQTRPVESRPARTSAPMKSAATPASHQRELPAIAAIEPMLVEPIVPVSEFATDASSVFVPQPDENFVARGVETFEAREYAKSVGYWQAEIDARPQRAWSQYMLGLSLWKNGQHDEAAAAMEASIAIDPSSIKSFVNLSRIQNDRGDFEQALEAARAGLEVIPDDPSAQFLAARSLFNLDRFDEAEVELITCLAADPDNGYAQNLLGLVFMRQERDLEAIVAFEKAAELRPETAFIRNNLGMALELGGERSEAIASYSKAVELDPDHTKAASNLARLQPVEPVIETEAVVEADPTTEQPVTIAVATDTGADGVRP